MSLTILANALDSVPVFIQLDDGDATKFPQAEIRNDTTGGLITTLDLTHVANGLYMTTYTVPAVDKYLVQYIVYDDAGHTTVSADFGRDSDLIIADFTPPATVVPTLEASGVQC